MRGTPHHCGLPVGRLVSKLLDLWADLTGVVLDYALKTPPGSGWLLCYGQVLLPDVPIAARLRKKLIDDGMPYGADANGNPFIPDSRGRTTAGRDNMGGTAAGRLAGSPASTLGGVLGSQTHALTTAEMPSHSHTVYDPGHSHGVYDPTHGHNVASQSGTNGPTNNPDFYPTGLSSNDYGYKDTKFNPTNISIYGAGTGISIQATGSGTAHDITQPTLIMNKIIKL